VPGVVPPHGAWLARVDDEAMTLAREIHGEGPPLLLVHGLGSSRTVWRPVVPALAEQFTVIALDLPGHGDSPPLPPGADATPAGLAGSVSAVLDELGVDEVDTVGNSLGGWVVLELARQGRARSVTALAPAGFWVDDVVPVTAHVNRWASKALAPVAPTLLKVRPLRAIGFWTASADAAAMDPQDAIDAVRAHAGARGWARALAGTHHRRCDARDIPADIPVTIVWGDADRILPAARCESRDGAPAHARWVRLDRCGHVPMWDQPDETVRLVRETVAAGPRSPRPTTPQPAG
jgi:pimeloyl-ACP methyl ester carboxylesterase